MQSHFVFRHMESSEPLRNYAEERLSKISKYFSDPMKVSCTFAVEKIQHVAQFDVTLRNGLQLHASESTENMYSSIDLALAKMERQVRRYKDKITNHKPNRGRAAKIRQTIVAPEGLERNLASEMELPHTAKPSSLPVVRTKEFKTERMSAEQAAMQMNLMQRSFLVFTNEISGDINVIYRDDDSNYGLIETNGHVDDA